MSMETVSGRFPDLKSAERAVKALLDCHIPEEAITVLARAHGELVERALEYETGVVPGAAAGGAIGTLAGLLGAAVIATGPVAPALAPIAVVVWGGATGSIGGALTGLAWWRETARFHADEFDRTSAVWVAVHHETLVDLASHVLEEQGATVLRRPIDPVDEASDESFPASDPPSFTGGHA